jgi:Xaa-Pro aminopeptidase
MDKLIIAPGTEPDQFYATGLQLHTFITLLRGKKTYVAGGGFEYPQLKARFPGALRFEDLGKDFPSVIRAFCAKHKVSKPLMPATTPAAYFRQVRGASLADDLLPERAVKKQRELREIKAMQRAAEDAIAAVQEVLAASTVKEGKARHKGVPLTSEQLKRVAAVELARHDASCPDMIISSGRQTALPHHRGSGVIRAGAVIVDIFPRSHESRYFADCTRTFVLGKAPKGFEERYEAVLAVQRAAEKLARHGAEGIDQQTRGIFSELGFATDRKKGKGYIHGLGHGVGLEIHENPKLTAKLCTGNVVTLEPGLYYEYGIRVEDLGVVRKNGFTNFSTLSKNPYV